MRKRVTKYLLIIIASFVTGLAINVYVSALTVLIENSGLETAGNDLIALIIFIFLLFIFSFLTYKNNNKYSVYAIIVILSTAILCVGVESFDSYFTNDHEITIGWMNLFGWNKIDSNRDYMEHRDLGFLIIIFPTILISCSLFFYRLLLKKRTMP